MIAAARELRDRWLEMVNASESVDALRPIAAKYDVRRQRSAAQSAIPEPRATPLFEAA
jgi:hypothetical protein